VAKYVLVYTSGGVPASVQDRAVLMQAWRVWVGSLGSAVVDPGNPFGPSMTVAPDSSSGDGGSSELRGYMIFSADSLAAATILAQGCPYRTHNGGTIEIYETLPID
jgi:hypothetical protein